MPCSKSSRSGTRTESFSVARTGLLIALGLLLAPCAAHANMGPPIFMMGSCFLSWGMAVIGLLEAGVIALISGGRWRRLSKVMIGANYLSALAGVIALPLIHLAVRGVAPDFPDLNSLLPVFAVLGILVFALSVLIEWPFCHKVLREYGFSSRKTLALILIAQIVSYALITPLFLKSGAVDLLVSTNVDRSLSFSRGEAYVYFISSDDSNIYLVRTDGHNLRKVNETHIPNTDARLFARRNGETGKWDLWVHGHPGKDSDTLIKADFARSSAPSANSLRGHKEAGNHFNFGRAADLRSENNRDWKVSTDFWAGSGFSAENVKTGERVHLSLETPFLMWNARNATVLPDNQVVFQLGDQVVLFDPVTRKIGLLAMGRGPVVAMDIDKE